MLIKNGNERYKGEKLATLKTHLAVQLKNEDLPKAVIPSALRPDQSWFQFIFNAFHIQTPVT